MLRVHDVPGAFAGRDWPVDGDVAFSVAGDHVGTTNGATGCWWSSGGRPPASRPRRPTVRVLTPGGLALAWAGAQTCANLRMAGHLSGPATNDEALDAVLGAGRLHIRDYF